MSVSCTTAHLQNPNPNPKKFGQNKMEGSSQILTISIGWKFVSGFEAPNINFTSFIHFLFIVDIILELMRSRICCFSIHNSEEIIEHKNSYEQLAWVLKDKLYTCKKYSKKLIVVQSRCYLCYYQLTTSMK